MNYSSFTRCRDYPLIAVLIVLMLAAGCERGTSQQYLERAKALRAKGDSAAAEIQVKNALVLNPQEAEARYLLGVLLDEKQDGASAESELRRANDLGWIHGGHVKAELARALFIQQNYQKLLDEISTSPAFEDSANAEILALRGSAHLALRQFAEAQAALDEAYKKQPDSVDVLIGLASFRRSQGDSATAKSLAEQALQKFPNSYRAWAFKADLLRALKNNDEAIAAYRKAVEIAPNQLMTRFELGSLLLETGKIEEAQQIADAMRKVSKRNPLVDYLQGLIQYQQGNYPAARDSVFAALKGAPDFPPLILLAGAVHYSTGSLVLAEKYLSQFVRANPDNLYARKLLAATLIDMKEGKRAIEIIEPVLRKGGVQDTALLALVGNAELQSGDLTKATSLFDQALASDPNNPMLLHGLGLTQLAAGDIDRAVNALEAASEKAPNEVKSDLVLTMTLLGYEKYDMALEAIRRLDKKQPGNPVVQNLMGVAYMGKDDKANARQAFERALSLAPNYLQAVSNLAQLDLQEGRAADAQKRFETLLSGDKNNVRALLALAGMAGRAGDRKRSLDLLQQAVKANTAMIETWKLLAQQQFAAGDRKAALETAQSAVKANPGLPGALDLLGSVQLALGQVPDALTTYQQLTSLVPGSPLAHTRLAAVQVARDQTAAAESSYQRALQLDPKFVGAHVGLAMLRARAGRADDALKQARQLKDSYPKAAVGNELEGDVLMVLERYGAAVKAYQAAYAAFRSGRLMSKVFMAEVRAGDSAGAVTRLSRWVEANPGDLAVRRLLADAMLQTGQQKAAVSHYQYILRKNPNDVMVLNNLASALQDLKDPRALGVARQAYKRTADNVLIVDTLAWILIEQGNIAEGLPLARKAVSLSPQLPVARYHLAVGLAKSGDRIAARKELEQVLADGKPFRDSERARALLKQL